MKPLLTNVVMIGFSAHVILFFILFLLALGVMQNARPGWRKGLLYSFPPSSFDTEKSREIRKWFSRVFLALFANLALMMLVIITIKSF